MGRRLSAASVCASLVAVVAFATPARAQTPGTHFNIAAGASFPTGDFSLGTDVGYNVSAGITLTQRASPLAFRAEGMYNEFNASGFSDKARAAAITGNAVYDFSSGSIAPLSTLYLIGGIGYYNTRDPFLTSETQSNLGWNVGGGFRFGLTGFSAYLEARFHTVTNTDVRFIPVTFGLLF